MEITIFAEVQVAVSKQYKIAYLVQSRWVEQNYFS